MRDLVDELLRAQVKARLFGAFHAPTLGRLELVGRLGSGAMGTVFAAYDPRLDRKVAVKVLREPGDGVRVLREARALGKLAHPNVVAIHDADELDGTVYIVMELAPGVTLRTWLETPRSWRAIALALCQAGTGIAAAHRAGLVHRDIKPDNMLVGDDRVRVVDFGLAGIAEDPATAGTPSYMAPEVLAGAAATEASDQFSFAVTCYEALCGKRPHPGTTRAELATAAATSASAPSFPPAWLHAVIARGLAAEPAQRYPSMATLLDALERGLHRRRQRGYAIAAAALAIGGLLGAVGYRSRATRDPCGGAAERGAAIWSPELAARVRVATTPWGDRSTAALDAIVTRWEGSYHAVCEATRVRGDQSDHLLELRMRCLDRTLDRVGALAGVLAEPLDATARANALTAIGELPAPDHCEQLLDAGELALPADPAQRARALAAEHELDRGWALFGLGRYRDARTTLTADSEVPALHAAALALDGAIEARIGVAARARERLDQALQAAAAAHAPELELDIWARLLRNELFGGDSKIVIEQAPFARAAAARAGREGAEIDGIVGEALRNANRLDEARAILRRALASHDPLRPDQRAVIEMNVGSVELAAGNPVAAETAFVHAESVARAMLGDGHPELALYADKLASAARTRGKLRDALAHHAASLAARERAFGADDRAVATSLFHRSQTWLEAGQLSKARADLERARAIRAKVWGAGTARNGEIEAVLGDVAAAGGHADDARAHYDDAAHLDPRLRLNARLLALGTAVPQGDVVWVGTLAVESGTELALGVRRLGDTDAGRVAAPMLMQLWTATPSPVDAALSCAVAEALDATGDHEDAASVFHAALAALADEPSRTRLRALTGLHHDTTALHTAMPELVAPRDR